MVPAAAGAPGRDRVGADAGPGEFIFPARRTRDLLSIVALGAAGGLILLFG